MNVSNLKRNIELSMELGDGKEVNRYLRDPREKGGKLKEISGSTEPKTEISFSSSYLPPRAVGEE